MLHELAISWLIFLALYSKEEYAWFRVKKCYSLFFLQITQYCAIYDFYQGSKTWNSLPLSVTCSTSFPSFKKDMMNSSCKGWYKAGLTSWDRLCRRDCFVLAVQLTLYVHSLTPTCLCKVSLTLSSDNFKRRSRTSDSWIAKLICPSVKRRSILVTCFNNSAWVSSTLSGRDGGSAWKLKNELDKELFYFLSSSHKF